MGTGFFFAGVRRGDATLARSLAGQSESLGGAVISAGANPLCRKLWVTAEAASSDMGSGKYRGGGSGAVLDCAP